MWEVADPDGGAEPIYLSACCPLPTIPARIWALFGLYRHYQRGVLLTAGGLLDQPHFYLEAMNLIEQVFDNGKS